ncbi:Na(+)-translocating NADH-quinone reductase subunit A [Halovulum sp. GXIMD14794]
MEHRIRRGLQIRLPGAPRQAIGDERHVASAGVLGSDYPGMRPEVLVAEGNAVGLGAPLFRDRHRPEILITAPMAGHVARIEIGARRRLAWIEIRATDAPPAPVSFDSSGDDAGAVEGAMQASGLWAAFRTRPFGRVPDPGARPGAIFVTAMDTEPLAADIPTALAGSAPLLERGLAALELLTDGPVYLCQPPGGALTLERGRVRVARFSGVHPAGLPGTHIEHLHPVAQDRSVWQIHAQEVVALGHLLQTGTLPANRVIALSGPGLEDPRLLRVPGGASLAALAVGEMRKGNWHLISGSPISGRGQSFLGRHHWQITALPDRPAPPPRRRSLWPADHRQARPEAVIPTRALDLALGPAIPAMPLIRALCSGDAETADRLGCRALLEEDVALLDYAAGGRAGLPQALRRVLDMLEAA